MSFYEMYDLLCSEPWAPSCPAMYPISLENQPLESAWVLTSDVTVLTPLCFSTSFLSSGLWTTSPSPRRPRMLTWLSPAGCRAVYPQGRAGQSNAFSPSHTVSFGAFPFFKEWSDLVTLLARSQRSASCFLLSLVSS